MKQSEQAAAYALGELHGADLTAFEARLAEEPELRQEVDAMRATMTSLEGLPAEAWPGSDADPRPAIESEDAVRPARGRERRGHRMWRLRPALVVALLVAAAVLGGVAGALLNSGDGSGESGAGAEIVLHRLDAPTGAGADISMPAPTTMLLRVHGLKPSEAGDYYEIWLMNDAESLVPVASFRVGPSGSAQVEVPLPADPTAYRYFDVSRQTVAGGTGHSGDSVLRGAT